MSLGFNDILSDWWDCVDFDVSRIKGRGHSLLSLAVMAGSASICKRLIERGANVNQRLETHRTYNSSLVAAVSFKVPSSQRFNDALRIDATIEDSNEVDEDLVAINNRGKRKRPSLPPCYLLREELLVEKPGGVTVTIHGARRIV